MVDLCLALLRPHISKTTPPTMIALASCANVTHEVPLKDSKNKKNSCS